MYKHIMLPLDGSDFSMKAVTEAVTIAKAMGSKLTLFTVVHPYHTGVTTRLASDIIHEIEKKRDDELTKEVQKLHTDVAARVKAENVQCGSLVVVGDNPYAKIIENAQASNCDLIVMASHGRRGVDAFLIGSETVKVLSHSKIPVLVVR